MLVFASISLLLSAQQKILFDASKAETAGNADWVLDADTYNLRFFNDGTVNTSGSEANAQRFPTPAQSGISASTLETYWTGGLSAFGVEMVKQGFQVETLPWDGNITYGDVGNVQDLSNYDVYVMCEPNIMLTASEKTAILNFVSNGGGLYMLADHGGDGITTFPADRNNDGNSSIDVFNDLMAGNPFGMSFDNVYLTENSTNIATLPGDPLLHGIAGDVGEHEVHGSATITLSTGSNASVLGVIYKTGSSNTGASNCLVAYATYGSGRVVGMADSSPAEDITSDPGDTTFDGWIQPTSGANQGDNGVLITNATIWLAGSISPEPTNDPTVFTAVDASSSQIDLSWTEATGANLPNGYLILANKTGTFTDPVDGTDPTTDTNLADGSAVLKVSHGARAATNFTGLDATTQYFFKIWSYSNSGTSIDYKVVPATTQADDATTRGALATTCEDFDGLNEGSYGNYTEGEFDINNGLCASANARTGNAVRLRNNSTSYLELVGSDGNGVDGGVGDISFWYRAWDSSPTAVYDVSVNINGGGYTTIGTINTSSTTYAEFTHTLNDATDNIKIRIKNTSGERLHVDDFCYTDYSASGPEINILGNSVTIADGDLTPTVTDHTDFGSVATASGTIVRTFTIENTGASDLTLSGGSPFVTVSGTHAGDFTVTAAASSPISAAGSTTFNVTFDPSANGQRDATLTITSDDIDEGTYNFDIQGTGTATPDITLADNGTQISAADVSQGTTKHAIHSFTLTVADATTTLTQADFTSGGTYIAADVDKFQLWYHTSDDLSAASQIGTDITTSLGGGSHSFTTLSQALSIATHYFWITTDVDAAGTVTNTINSSAVTTGGLTFASGTESGSTTAGAAQTIIAFVGPCASETFANSNAGTGYSSSSFVGDNGVTWTYVASRDENGDANGSGISGNALMLRDLANSSKVTSSSVAGGIGDFSVLLYKGFTGGGSRQVELFVNGVSKGVSASFDDFLPHTFSVSGINITGNVIVELRNITTKQTIVDDIQWTCYAASGPEINILGNSVTIADEDVTPTITDHTDFGSVATASGTIVRTFTIENTGVSDLTLSGGSPFVTVSGTHAGDFTVTAAASSPISAAGSTTFNVTFDPSADGQRDATLTITSDDIDEGTYNFDIQGTGTATPDITLADNGTQISAADVAQGTTKHAIHSFTLTVADAATTLTQADFTSAGSYIAADVDKFQLWYHTSDDLSAATQIGTDITTTLGGGSHSFTALTQALSIATHYFWITTDIDATGTISNTINSSAVTTGGLTFASGTESGSTTAGAAQTITAAVVTYCPSEGDGTDTYFAVIRNVTFGSIDQDSPKEDNAYTDNTGISTTLMQGSSEDISISLCTDGNWTYHCFVWIDWNHDGTFNTSDEQFDLGTVVNSDLATTTLSPTTINIPGGAVVGSTRMRVSMRYSSDPTPCLAAGFDGEVEDYTVNIIASGPVLTVNPTTLAGYSYVVGSGPSGIQSFDLSGSNLDGTEVVVTAPANYEVSLDGTTWFASRTVSYTAPTLASTTISVRLKSGLSVGTYNSELVTCNDDGTASNVSVSNSGEVTSLPSITLADNGTQVAVADVSQGTTKHALHTFTLTVADASTQLSQLDFVTSGSIDADDIVKYQLWYNTTNDLSVATQIGTDIAAPGVGGTESFTGLTQALSVATHYFWITADIATAPTADISNTVHVSSVLNTGFAFTGGSASGSTTAGGVQTIIAYVGPFAYQGFEIDPGTPPDTWTVLSGTYTDEDPTKFYVGTKAGEIGSGSQTILLDNIDLTAYENVVLSVAYASSGVDTGEDLILEISYDGGTTWTGTGSTTLVSGFSNLGLDFGDAGDVTNPYTVNVSNAESQISVRFRTVGLDGGEFYYLDDVKLDGTVATCEEPATDATNMTFSTITGNSMDVNWTNGNGSKRIIVAREAAAVNWAPTDGTTYTANSSFGSSTGLGVGSDNFVVFDGGGSSVSITNLNGGTEYFYKVFEYKCIPGSEDYFINGTTLEDSQSTLIGDISNLQTSCVSNSSAQLTWDLPAGEYDAVLVAINPGSSPLVPNVAGATLLSASSDFSSTVGYSGGNAADRYVLNGDLSTVEITNLTASTNYTVKVFAYKGGTWSAGVETTINTVLKGVTLESAIKGNAYIDISWTKPTTCFDKIIVVGNDGGSPSEVPDGLEVANSDWSLAEIITTNDKVVYNGTGSSVRVNNLVNGNSYCFKIYVMKGTDITTGVEVAGDVCATPLDITIIEPGNLAIISTNTTHTTVGEEFTFVCFQDVKAETPIDFTDNGWEAVYAGYWGDGEGSIRITRKNSILPAGTSVTVVMNGANGNSDTDFDIYVNGVDDLAAGNWTLVKMNAGAGFNMNRDDDLWVMQNGEWIDGGADKETYSGNILYGWTATGWPGVNAGSSDENKISFLYPGLNCFQTNVSGKANKDKVKYNDAPDNFLVSRTKYEWIAQFNDANNWDDYSDDATYDAGTPLYRQSGVTVPIVAGTAAPGIWTGVQNTDWFDCGNWLNLTVPTSSTDVIIDAPYNNDIDVDNTSIEAPAYGYVAECNTLTINQNTLTIEADKNDILEIHSDLVISGTGLIDMDSGTAEDGIIRLYGNWTNSSSANTNDAFTQGKGTVQFLGTTEQTISNTNGETFANIIVNNSSATGVTMDDNVTTEKVLTHTDGFINLNGNDITISGDYIRTNGLFKGNVSSDMLINSSGSIGDIYFNTDLNLDNFTMNRAGENVNLMTNLTVANTMKAQNGSITFRASKNFTVNNLENTLGLSSALILKSDISGTTSLIQQTGAVAATSERYLVGGKWNFMFSPLNAMDGAAILQSSGEFGYSYNETPADYWNATTIYGTSGWVAGLGSPTSVEKGYIHHSSSSKTYSLTGGNLDVTPKTFVLRYTPHAGSSNVPDYHTDGLTTAIANTQFDGWNLVGNPYASALDWDAGGWDKTQIEAFVYYYDGANYQCYGASPWDQGITASSTVSGTGTQFIPANQGFFVKAKSTGDLQDFSIPTGARTHNAQAFWRSPATASSNLLRLSVSKDGFSDGLVIRTLPSVSGVTAEHDGSYDAYKMFSWDNTKPQIFSKTEANDRNFAINSLPEFTGHKIVPLGVYVSENGEYTLSSSENSFENIHIWIEDRALEVNTVISNGETYSFTQTAESNTNRFYVHFDVNNTPVVLATIPDQLTKTEEAYSYTLPANMFADEDANDVLSYTAQLQGGHPLPEWLTFDAETGLFSGTPSEVQTLAIEVKAQDVFGAFVTDVFVLTVETAISVSEISNELISIYPNPATEIVIVYTGNKFADANIAVVNIAGQSIQTMKSTGTETKINVSELAQGIYFIEISKSGNTIRKKLMIK